jgi:hypothetical protein
LGGSVNRYYCAHGVSNQDDADSRVFRFNGGYQDAHIASLAAGEGAAARGVAMPAQVRRHDQRGVLSMLADASQ